MFSRSEKYFILTSLKIIQMIEGTTMGLFYLTPIISKRITGILDLIFENQKKERLKLQDFLRKYMLIISKNKLGYICIKIMESILKLLGITINHAEYYMISALLKGRAVALSFGKANKITPMLLVYTLEIDKVDLMRVYYLQKR